MTIYFVFSDEAGTYQKERNEGFTRSNPFYVRSAILLRAHSWAAINQDYIDIRQIFNMPKGEIKWSYLWSLKKHRKSEEEIPIDKPYYFLKDISERQLLRFINSVLKLIESHDITILFTVTINDNYRTPSISVDDIYKWHVQNLMQRVEMGIQDDTSNLAVFFFDSIDADKEQSIRNAYANIYQAGDFIEKYTHIKDSMSFEYSHHSIGIQLADYCAGIFRGVLCGYDDSTTLFFKRVYPWVRTSGIKDPMGYGIIEIPTNSSNRSYILDKINVTNKKFR